MEILLWHDSEVLESYLHIKIVYSFRKILCDFNTYHFTRSNLESQDDQ